MRFRWMMLIIAPLLYGIESEEEALFLRRIADFWQEKEVQLAKVQIEEFIETYPESTYSDALCAALGDLYLREKNYSSAIHFYNRVKSPEFYNRVFVNRMQCLHEMQWYATLADECESFLENGSDLRVTYFLAVALYHQCLNASKDPETLANLAQKAKPLFDTLLNSEFSDEVAQGFAHLCCILKDFEKASEIYLKLAQKDSESQEEMLFQAALVQSQYNKELSLETFEKIEKLGQKKGKEAAYNRMVLAFDMGRYDELTGQNLLDKIPAERKAMAHLFLGRSLVHLKKNEQAISEFKSFIETAPVSETYHAALLNLLETAYQSNDLASVDYAIEKMLGAYPNDAELPKAYFSRAQILKKEERLQEAKNGLEQLIAKFPEFHQKPQVIFELAHLDFRAKAWEDCYKRSRAFLTQFPDHELALFAWRYFVSSSAEMTALNPALRSRLVTDLENFLKLQLLEAEEAEWNLLLATNYLELQNYEKAFSILQNLESPNARLLLALCYKDGYSDLTHFCSLAETALAEGANLMALDEIHASIFNAYLELGNLDKAADHLFAAFMAEGDIQVKNLLWLADVYLSKLDHDERRFVFANRAAQILEKCKAALHSPEDVSCKLAKVYSILGRTDDQIALLENLENISSEGKLLLAEGYARKGIVEKATQLFDSIVATNGTVRDPISASACLQATRLRRGNGTSDLNQLATQLKNLVIQKTFEGEPTYLEAALDYVDLQAHSDPQKKLALLQKTKADFEKREDLLSKDYHAARSKWPEKDKIYQGYLELMDAEILALQASLEIENQNELKIKSKAILLKIVNEQSAAALLQRACVLLTDIDERKAKT